jgi:hypothetical protein
MVGGFSFFLKYENRNRMNLDDSVSDFRKLINHYKRQFVSKLETEHPNMQDMDNMEKIVIRSCDQLHRRLNALIELALSGAPPPQQSQQFEYAFYSRGGLEYVWATKDADDFIFYLCSDLRAAPYTTNTDIIDRAGVTEHCKKSH